LHPCTRSESGLSSVSSILLSDSHQLHPSPAGIVHPIDSLSCILSYLSNSKLDASLGLERRIIGWLSHLSNLSIVRLAEQTYTHEAHLQITDACIGKDSYGGYNSIQEKNGSASSWPGWLTTQPRTVRQEYTLCPYSSARRPHAPYAVAIVWEVATNRHAYSGLKTSRVDYYFFCLARANARAIAIVPAGCG